MRSELPQKGTSMYNILYIQPIHPEGMEYLRSKANYRVMVASATDVETLKREVRDADVIITRLTRLDGELLRCARHLKAVCKHGVGVDNIDVLYCKEHEIAVLTTGDANSSTVAEQAMLAIGALLRKTAWLNERMHRGDWQSRDRSGAVDLMGRTLGLIGYGRIGKSLAGMAGNGFRMKVCVFDPYARAEAERDGWECVDSLETLLGRADVISLHVPLTEETRGMIGEREMALMKKNAYIVNYSRGGIVSERALYENLRSGRLGGAALDVFEVEPPESQSNPLFELDNVILSPHCASFTEDSRRRMSMKLAMEIEGVLEGNG